MRLTNKSFTPPEKQLLIANVENTRGTNELALIHLDILEILDDQLASFGGKSGVRDI